jgi:hypothetical protein
MGRRPTGPLSCLRDGELVSAAAADRRGSLGRAFLRIEVGAVAASDVRGVVPAGQDVTALGTGELGFGILLLVRVRREHVVREEVHGHPAGGAGQALDPEEVQNLAGLTAAVRRPVKLANFPADAGLDFLVQRVDLPPVHRAERDADRTVRHGIDVAADDRASEFLGLSDGRSAPMNGSKTTTPGRRTGS